MNQARIDICGLVAALFLGCLLTSPGAAQTGESSPRLLPPEYQNWLDQDVRYLITDQERSDFSRLTTDRERDAFVEAFWKRHDPMPGSAGNSFKEAHYQRLAYANSNFAARLPGFKTDRGRIYILYGPPDNVQKHFSAARADLAVPYSWELWHYSYIPGIGKDVDFKFVDTCGCGEFRIPADHGDLKK